MHVLFWLMSLVSGSGFGILTSALFLSQYPGIALPLGIISGIVALISMFVAVWLSVDLTPNFMVLLSSGSTFGMFISMTVTALFVAARLDVIITPFVWIGGLIMLVGVIFAYLIGRNL